MSREHKACVSREQYVCSGSVFVINLEYRTDRRAEMERQLQRIGWDAEFFSAIQPGDDGSFPSVGAHGCFMSHLEVLKLAQSRASDRVVILEDDVNFTPGFQQHWTRATAMLGKLDWSIFYPGHCIKDLPKGLSLLAPDRNVLCAHFVLVNGPAISPLIRGLEQILARPAGHPSGGPMHVDGAYSTIRAQNAALETYAYSPALGYQRPSRSDVEGFRWFDRIGAISPIVAVARRLKGQVREAKYLYFSDS